MPVSPIYWEGRFSNGKVWTDYIAENLKTYKHMDFLNESEGGAALNYWSRDLCKDVSWWRKAICEAMALADKI